MLSSIRSSQNFKNELQKFDDALSKISNEAAKAEITRLIQQLIFEVKKIDETHSEMIYTKQIPTTGSEMRKNIFELRKKIDQKINENLKV